MKKDFKKMIIEKGQGLTEYVLILAFIAGVAFMMFGGDGSLKGTLANTLTKTVSILAELFGDGYITASKNYSTYYFHNWHDKTLEELQTESSTERLKADQEGLALIASYFLGKTKDEVYDLMAGFSNSYDTGGQWVTDNLKKERMGDVNDGWSDIMVPLSYWNTDFDTDGYYWFECSRNVNLIKEMAGSEQFIAEPKKGIDSSHSNRAGTVDRIFYSDGMIGSDSSNRAIAMKVHYNGDTVDQVWIAAQTGTSAMNKPQEKKGDFAGYDLSPGNSALHGDHPESTVKGLDLIVTGPPDNYKYKVNN